MPRKKGQTNTPKTQAEKDAAEKAKRTKFVELAEKRTTNALAAIKNIGKLANSRSYTFSENDAKAITVALTSAADAVHDLFIAAAKGVTATTEKTFSLSTAKAD